MTGLCGRDRRGSAAPTHIDDVQLPQHDTPLVAISTLACAMQHG